MVVEERVGLFGRGGYLRDPLGPGREFFGNVSVIVAFGVVAAPPLLGVSPVEANVAERSDHVTRGMRQLFEARLVDVAPTRVDLGQ